MPDLRTDFRAGPAFAPVADGLNAAGRFGNALQAAYPLFIHPNPYGKTLVFLPWDSPFQHPWRVGMAATAGKVNVAGGKVHDGTTQHNVTALSGETAADGWKCWLSVKHYYDRAVASEIALASGSSWAASAHTSTAMTAILRVAEIDGSTLYQYLYEDQFVPLVDPPLPDLVNVYFKMSIAGVVQWRLAGGCSTP